MIAAEKWYEYQENYQKYGLDMKPKEPRKRPRQNKATITSQDKARLLILTVIIGVLCIGMIITTAYAASIKYENNKIIEVNNNLEVEIENLDVQVEVANNVGAIEKKAKQQLGMVEAGQRNMVYLSKDGLAKAKSAKTAKQEAYNPTNKI